MTCLHTQRRVTLVERTSYFTSPGAEVLVTVARFFRNREIALNCLQMSLQGQHCIFLETSCSFKLSTSCFVVCVNFRGFVVLQMVVQRTNIYFARRAGAMLLLHIELKCTLSRIAPRNVFATHHTTHRVPYQEHEAQRKMHVVSPSYLWVKEHNQLFVYCGKCGRRISTLSSFVV